MLRDLELKDSYRSGRDALLDDFYIPCLQESDRYDRAVGYFSSALMHSTALAYSDFARRGARMRLICSPSLTEADFLAMKTGDQIRAGAIERVDAEVAELLENAEALPAASLLGALIAASVVDVRIAFCDNPAGLFHEKLGLFEDLDGKRVTFVGSANETYAAWGVNQEAFEVFGSWRSESELLRTRNHSSDFDRLWRDNESGTHVCRLGDVTIERLKAVAAADVDAGIALVRSVRLRSQDRRKLMEHQVAVVDSWESAGNRGIVNFATGAGKTLAALEAVRRWASRGNPTVILVPGKELHHQWASEIERALPRARVLLAGAGHGPAEWSGMLSAFTRTRAEGSDPHVVLATNATFASPEFVARLAGSARVLIVADEMHRTGTLRILNALEESGATATLGLSATYERKFDSWGTSRLVDFYGPVLEPVVGLAEAMGMGLLVPYDYYLHTVTLNDAETALYETLTKRIGRLALSAGSGEPMSEALTMLLIKRARILKQARNKVPMAIEVLSEEYRGGDRWLVYCDDTKQLHEVVAGCLDRGLPVMEYYSGMIGDREAVLKSLKAQGGVVVAIRCLDEGVDIPATDHAMILASSTVEREYVQRRGRVLRRAADKYSAGVHDLLLVDAQGGALTMGEARRALEFANLARNDAPRARLRLLIARSMDTIGSVLQHSAIELEPEEE